MDSNHLPGQTSGAFFSNALLTLQKGLAMPRKIPNSMHTHTSVSRLLAYTGNARIKKKWNTNNKTIPCLHIVNKYTILHDSAFTISSQVYLPRSVYLYQLHKEGNVNNDLPEMCRWAGKLPTWLLVGAGLAWHPSRLLRSLSNTQRISHWAWKYLLEQHQAAWFSIKFGLPGI